MSHYRESMYGPFELGRSYELEYRARVDHREALLDRDLSDDAIEIWWRMYFPPGGAGTTFVVSVEGTKLAEDGGDPGATGLWEVLVKIPTDKGVGTVIVETVAVDTGVPDASTPSNFREVPLDVPTQTSIVGAPTV